MIRVSEIGWKARAALSRRGGPLRILAPLRASIYLVSEGEIVWLGRAGSALHPRAMLTAEPLAAPGETVAVDAARARPWRPPALAPGAGSPEALREGCRALHAAVDAVGAPDGFGRLLVGRALAFPLEPAAGRAEALALACGGDDHAGAVAAATALLGLGPGLTPAGDDYVGGAFFARALLASVGGCDGAPWRGAGRVVRERAQALTHPISAALLGDLLEGYGHAPLHDLALAVATGAPLPRALDATRRLAAIGHSSGWDILAGFLAGVLGRARP